ncbi:protein of unknown function DUF214 [Beutenbergia cavernae DSM 12333]|uniref:ABC3 transporter permease C-terminal domain-containing protein n=1 Tax=Beutenbergia cavernae (strain ATCC BAA-8 / DSM 12333 / CCUG 43141 / JCM 11478 / NBRC 16432 / NCIMB 13614 / HKI 0122) TaxID=471853 RepID=C5BX45_BEUC1|nr:FtsX-like permease family protein [Beutenbergia cavernae]ACQ78720.1 protein of unknown function DUF214 [Beutenbergia cavernae DSM 12333]
MRRVAWREVREHLGRFGLSVLAVLLGVAFVTGTFSLRAMLSATFSSIVQSTIQGDAYLRGPAVADSDDAGGFDPADGPPEGGSSGAMFGGGGRALVPLTLADDAAAIDGVAQAVPDVSGPLVLVGADGEAVINGQAPSIGVALADDDPGVTIVEGRAPRAADEVALETGALAASGLAVGDATQVVLGDSVREVTVVGEASLGTPAAGATLTFLDLDTATAAYAPEGLVGSVAIYAEDGVALDDLLAALEPLATDDVEVASGDELREEANAQVQSILGFLGTFLLVFAGISLFVGAFIVANAFAMSVRQRQRDFALLRALGASPGQVFGVVLVQAAVVGLVGSAVGAVAGYGLVHVVRAGLRSVFGLTLSGEIPLSAATIAACVVAGTLVSVVAAAIPARRAALTAPVEAMRDDVVVTERSLLLRAIVGTVLLVLGAAGVVAAVRDADAALPGGRGLWLGVGAGAALLGTIAIAPVIARACARVLALPFLPIKPLGALARGNVTRNPRRTASTASALLIGMALVAACAVIAASAQASTRSIVTTEVAADLMVRSATGVVPADAVAAVEGVPGVGTADAVRFGEGRTEGPEGGSETATLGGIDAEGVQRAFTLDVRSGSLDALADGEVAVQQRVAVEQGWAVGDSIELTGDGGARLTTSIGAVIDSQVVAVDVLLADEQFDEIMRQPQVAAVLVDAAPGTSVADLGDALDTALEPFVVVSALDADELTSLLGDMVDQALAILYALLALSVIIAVLGIVNTLALSVVERTREIGLLRAVGLGRLQLGATITIESILIAVFGTFVGVAVGVALAAALPSVYADQGLSVLAVPWDRIGLILALAVVVGLVAAVGPAVRASRLPVLEAISTE